MAQNNVFVVMEFAGNTLTNSKIRFGGENALESAVNWAKSMNFVGKPEFSTRILGRKTPELRLAFSNGLVVTMIPELDAKFQCGLCGHPKDDPNPFCYGDCEEFREAEPEILIDPDAAEDALRKAFA